MLSTKLSIHGMYMKKNHEFLRVLTLTIYSLNDFTKIICFQILGEESSKFRIKWSTSWNSFNMFKSNRTFHLKIRKIIRIKLAKHDFFYLKFKEEIQWSIKSYYMKWKIQSRLEQWEGIEVRKVSSKDIRKWDF